MFKRSKQWMKRNAAKALMLATGASTLVVGHVAKATGDYDGITAAATSAFSDGKAQYIAISIAGFVVIGAAIVIKLSKRGAKSI